MGGKWGKNGILVREMSLEQRREYSRLWSASHPGYSSIKDKKKRKKWRVEMIRRLGEKCFMCGYSRSQWALEAHHLDPSLKTEDPCRLYRLSEEHHNNELKNCILLCTNCHAETHAAKTTDLVKNKAFQSRVDRIRIMGGNECQICGYRRNPTSLHFHHVFPEIKKFDIIKACRGKDFDAVCEEITKCVLLCANCHREVHSGFIPAERLLTIGKVHTILNHLDLLIGRKINKI